MIDESKLLLKIEEQRKGRMKIIRRGHKPTIPTITFDCGTCETIFEAEKGEYVACDQMEYMHDGLKYKCKCPVCQNWVYIERD